MPRIAKVNIYTQIINASFALLNEEDERNISTSHTAAHSGISPGNLYYHFRNRDKIVVQLFERYSEALLAYLNEAVLSSNVEGFINYIAGIYDTMWEYRFLSSDVDTLLARNVRLLGEHNTFTQTKVSPLLVDLLIQPSDLNIISADQTAMNDPTANMWMVTKYWFNFDSPLHGRAKLTEGSKIRDISRTLSLLRPYLLPEHRAEFDRKIGSNHQFFHIKTV